MNIFYLSHDPKQCAHEYFDKHVTKMILESVQMLSTASIILQGDGPYKMTHAKHPCTIWTAQSKENFLWLCELVCALNKEFIYRFDKNCNHKSYDVMLSDLTVPIKFPQENFLAPPLAMPEQFKGPCPIHSYRLYYLYGKAPSLHRWKKRDKPIWFHENFDMRFKFILET